jgi:hypothetical protein
MKKIVLKKTAILLFLAGSLVSCGKEKETQLLDLGIYVETYPIEGRTRVNLIDREKCAIIKSETSITEFYYTINYEEEIIELILIADMSLEEEMIDKLYFKTINSYKFEIENLYPQPLVGSNTPSLIMTFEKKNTINN